MGVPGCDPYPRTGPFWQQPLLEQRILSKRLLLAGGGQQASSPVPANVGVAGVQIHGSGGTTIREWLTRQYIEEYLKGFPQHKHILRRRGVRSWMPATHASVHHLRWATTWHGPSLCPPGPGSWAILAEGPLYLPVPTGAPGKQKLPHPRPPQPEGPRVLSCQLLQELRGCRPAPKG